MNHELMHPMGDHGAWVPPVGLTGVPNPDGKSLEVINPEVMALAVPLLAVKRPGASGPLQVSDAPSWIVDTAATIARATGLEGKFPGQSVFDLDPSESRVRKFLYYEYRRRDWTDDYLEPIQEFIVDGSVLDSSSWRHTVTYLPRAQVEKAQGKSDLWRTFALD